MHLKVFCFCSFVGFVFRFCLLFFFFFPQVNTKAILLRGPNDNFWFIMRNIDQKFILNREADYYDWLQLIKIFCWELRGKTLKTADGWHDGIIDIGSFEAGMEDVSIFDLGL